MTLASAFCFLLAVSGLILIIDVVLYRFFRKKPATPAKHEHRAKILGTQYPEADYKMTTILIGCECGDPSRIAAYVLHGVWTVEELKGIEQNKQLQNMIRP